MSRAGSRTCCVVEPMRTKSNTWAVNLLSASSHDALQVEAARVVIGHEIDHPLPGAGSPVRALRCRSISATSCCNGSEP